MKIFRLSGLISFIVITATITLTMLFFAGPIIENTLETKLTEANGARVDIADLDISLIPLSISIHDIQVTDPQRPMVNTVQIERISMLVPIGDLLLEKLNIDTLDISGIRLDSKRDYSGAITPSSDSEKMGDEKNSSGMDLTMPKMSTPDIKSILAKEPLITEKRIAQLNKDIDSSIKKWNKTKDELGNTDKYDAEYANIQTQFKGGYREKYKAIKKAKKLIKKLKAEAKTIKQAQRGLNKDMANINRSFKQLKNAPKEDAQRIKSKYQLNSANTGNITQLIFGAQAAEYATLATKWYDRISPYLESDEDIEEASAPINRSKGIDIAFTEYNPLPCFYVRTANIDAILATGKYSGNISDISSDQSINKKPTLFSFSGTDLSNRESETIKGEINYINKNNSFSDLKYQIKKYQLTDYPLSKSESLPLTLNKAEIDLKLNAKYTNGDLKGSIKSNFNHVSFNNQESDSSGLGSLISSSFKDIRNFNVNASFNGGLDDLSFKIRSNLNKKVGGKIKSQLNKKKKQFEKELEQAIHNKVKSPMGKLNGKNSSLGDISSVFDKNENDINNKIGSLKSSL